MKKYNWKAYTGGDRYHITNSVLSCLDKSGAYILNSTRMSDMVLELVLEIEECKVQALYLSLQQVIKMPETDLTTLVADSRGNAVVYFNLTYT